MAIERISRFQNPLSGSHQSVIFPGRDLFRSVPAMDMCANTMNIWRDLSVQQPAVIAYAFCMNDSHHEMAGKKEK